MKRRIAKATTGVITLTAVLGLIVITPQSANATGYAGFLCGQDNQYSGFSNVDYAQTNKQSSSCGNPLVRARYELYPGSLIYWSPEVLGTGQYATFYPGSSVTNVGGVHSMTSPGWFYSEPGIT